MELQFDAFCYKIQSLYYPLGLLIAPVIFLSGWKRLYGELID